METAILTLTKETVAGLEEMASQIGVSSADLAEKAIRQYLRREADKKIIQEETAYRAQYPQLKDQYAGQYIAMHNGQVIDNSPDEMALYRRIRQQYPLFGILIKQVTSTIDDVWHVRSPRLEQA